MNEFFSRIEKEFRTDFIRRDAETCKNWGQDWTRYHVPAPCGVAFPTSTDEVSRLLKLCSEFNVPVVPSGGRTGLAAGAVAAKNELVVSLEKMNRMDPVDPLGRTVRVQAGAITEMVHRHCEPHGLTWPVDFASKGSSHVGGNIATNAGGLNVIRFGLTRHWVLGLQVVTMNGDILELNGALEKNNTGLDLRQLFIGSEGTLGIITEATLKLESPPRDPGTFFFALLDIPAVLDLFLEARRGPFTIQTFEMLSRACMDLVCAEQHLTHPFPEPAGAYVLLEAETPDHPEETKKLDDWLEKLFESGLVLNGTLAQSPKEAKSLRAFRESISESLSRRSLPHKNDIALPIASLVPFVEELVKHFPQKHPELEIYIFGHIGDGNLHINTLKPGSWSIDAFLEACHESDRDLFRLVQRFRGSVSAEHGIGLLKKDALPFSRSPEELAIMRAIKQVMDPKGLLNPGKIL